MMNPASASLYHEFAHTLYLKFFLLSDVRNKLKMTLMFEKKKSSL